LILAKVFFGASFYKLEIALDWGFCLYTYKLILILAKKADPSVVVAI